MTQLGERSPYKREVAGSSPAYPTIKNMKNFKRHKGLVTKGILLFILVWGMVAGLIFLSAWQEIKVFNKEVWECYKNLKTEVDQLKEQEKELKQKFAQSSQLSEKGQIKDKLNSLQKTLFDKKHELSYHPYLSQFPEKTSKKRDKKVWANSIKEKLKKQLTELQNGTYKEPEYSEWGGFQGDPIFQFYFARFELDKKDCQEISIIIRQINAIQKIIREQEQKDRDEKLENNPNLFHCSSARPDGNCFIEWKGMQGYVSFHKVENGKIYRLMVRADHPVLDNVLFNDGWGTNSEFGPWYEITGTENIPIEESPHPGTAEQFRRYKFVELKDEITINYFTKRERVF